MSSASIASHFLPKIGAPVQDIPTPALLVDLDVLESNIRKLPTLLPPNSSVSIRAHAKAHKCPDLAKLQIQLGQAVGVCCQKLSEAMVMADAGIQDVLISNEVVAVPKLEQIARLAAQSGSRVTVCVDNAQVAMRLSEAAVKAAATVGVLVDVNVGHDRCGIEPGKPAVELAQLVKSLPGLSFRGIQAYHGNLQHVREFDERQEAVRRVAELARQTVDGLKAVGIDCEIVSGGGTGTFQFESASVHGSYVFMDADYQRNRGGAVKEFQQSLFVAATCMSVARDAREPRVVVDAGLKALSIDSGAPLVKDFPDTLLYSFGGDEHGILTAAGASEEAKRALESVNVGDVVLLVPGHCDPTVNMHEYLIGVRGGKVASVWPISARGVGF